METVDTFIAWKKKIQCNAINNPTNVNLDKTFGETLNDFFLILIKQARKTAAKNILYQTKKSDSIVINAPKIAVKPQIKTIECKLR